MGTAVEAAGEEEEAEKDATHQVTWSRGHVHLPKADEIRQRPVNSST